MKCIIAQGLTTVVNLQNKQNLLMRKKLLIIRKRYSVLTCFEGQIQAYEIINGESVVEMSLYFILE